MLIGALVVIYIYNKDREKEIAILNDKLKDLEKKEIIVDRYSDDIDDIKKLEQEIFGQENKINEVGKQVSEVTDLLIKNKEKIDKLENE